MAKNTFGWKGGEAFYPGEKYVPLLRPAIPDTLKKTLAHAPVEGVKVAGKKGEPPFLPMETGVNAKQRVWYNPPVAVLYELAILKGDSFITNTGAIMATSGKKTGRSPTDKRVVEEPSTVNDVWWGPVNKKISHKSFMMNRERALDYINTQEDIIVIDTLAGWDPAHQMKIRIVCTRPYHAIFMYDMMIRPTPAQLASYGEPDFVVYNAGVFPCNRYVPGVGSECSVNLHFGRNEQVILGTQYAGEMKKGILTVWMYWGPKRGILTLHSSCTEGDDGKCALFFGLSGTGKTTLAADPKRKMIGDDEHVWTETGVFNIEGGCYAKCINLKREFEPDIYDSIKFGAIMENVELKADRSVDYTSAVLTENTRVAFPLEHISNTKFPAITGHPKDIILLTCDAFGVLPPVAKLSPAQASYQFVAGYTAKVAGTEVGITDPVATFSPCFGGPFLVLHPAEYAKMLAEKMSKFKAHCWLLNTGWSGGKYGVGKRMSLKITRAIVDAINSGELEKQPTRLMPGWGLQVPISCPGVPSEILDPIQTWTDKREYKVTLNKLAAMFNKNFAVYASGASPEVLASAPKAIPVDSKL